MTPAARLQAASEILDEVIASARDDGPPADAIVTRYFKHAPLCRIGGSPSRARARVPRDPALRRDAPRAGEPRSWAWPRTSRPCVELFGEPRGPEPQTEGEETAAPGVVPDWLVSELSPLDRRKRMAGAARAGSARSAGQRRSRLARRPACANFPTPPRRRSARGESGCPPDSRVDDQPAYLDGRVEIQDEGSQLIALACEPGERRAPARPLRRSGRQGAGAGRRGARRNDPRDRQQSRAPVQTVAARRTGGRGNRDPPAQPAQRA